MNLLLKLILNRFILSILILFLFAIDYKFINLSPLQIYDLNRPPVTEVATEYYEIEFGAATIYIEITYSENQIYLVPQSETPLGLTLTKPIVAWYYYVLGLALVNIIPFKWFLKSNKPKKKKK